jgi:hypothetical protein
MEQQYGNGVPLPVITCDGDASSTLTRAANPPTESDAAGAMAAGGTIGSTCLLQPTPVAAARAALLLAPPPAVLGSAVPGSCVGRTAGNAGTVGVAGGGGGSTCSKTVLVTPYGSFLSVNQSPAEFRESTLSIGGGSSIGFNNCTGQIAAAARE